ncbi:hypothetical protein LF1_48370 [Rubripirellula obstinata]|uniref:DUF1598 domain-containing protein n=1 Tax=Rubripirellula obstinata TaxID=406547 RepID=A0A5B1CST8_9BACT|nr:DUF1598 domain-containing protein [Rubripirellula obstinata]KAA1262274.1 hypothetical protein LF1_48370 [Rubripirellula obstinata]
MTHRHLLLIALLVSFLANQNSPVWGQDNRQQQTGVAGGGSFADFASLIDLIQTTVVPDTWDALGGPSSMREYPQGVYVDPSGTLLACETVAQSDSLANLESMLQSNSDSDAGQNWLAESTLRCVSLTRLKDAWMNRQAGFSKPTESMVHMAGLSKVRYVMLTDDDIVLAGPVGGIESHQGWVRDRQTGLAAIRLDFLSTTIAAARSKASFGCTIDPTKQGLQNAAKVAANIQSKSIPIGLAAEELASAIGMQRIEVFGTAADTPIGLMMVEADRHMKQLALGIHPMPAEVANYLDAIDTTIQQNAAQGPPNDLLLRLWFTANACQVRSDTDRRVFQIDGDAMRLSGQNERAMADGQRGHVIDDPRTKIFVDSFNGNASKIRSKYPIYAGLQSIYESAVVAAIADKYAASKSHESLLDFFAATSSSASLGLPIPKQVQTIAVMHRTRSGKQRHNILIASGGVAVKPSGTVAMDLVVDPTLRSFQNMPGDRPKVIQRWWWDAN